MKKEMLKKLKEKEKSKELLWSDTPEQLKTLEELILNGISASTIINDNEVMETLFLGRSRLAVERKHGRLKKEISR